MQALDWYVDSRYVVELLRKNASQHEKNDGLVATKNLPSPWQSKPGTTYIIVPVDCSSGTSNTLMTIIPSLIILTRLV
jgi:hypothetical protein